MKKILLFLFLTACIIQFSKTTSFAGNDGYNISVKINGFQDTVLYLAYNYGNKKYIKDTISNDKNGYFTFSGDEPLDGGIYLIVIPPKNNYFEIIVDKDQNFKVETELDNLIEDLKITGSLENQIFYDYMRFLGKMRKQSDQINEKIKDIVGEPDSTEAKKPEPPEVKPLKEQLKELDKEVKDYQNNIIEKYPNSFYAKLLKTMREPEVPDPPKDEYGNIDYTFTFKYYKKHFFDNVDFSDDRLLRTPVYHNKIKEYITRLTVKHPDSISVACDYLLSKARANDEIFKYTLIFLLNKYANSKIMGMDAVYVYLVNNYYAKGDAPWMDSVQLYRMVERAKILKPLLIGKIAPDLLLHDLNGNYIDMHKIKADYLMLIFFDPDCGHCKKAIPQFKKVYDKYKDRNLKVYAVCTETEVDKWKKFIDEHHLENWINVGDPELHNNFRELYDIKSTPRVFLLDDKKNIIAKQITAEQLDKILEQQLQENQKKDAKATGDSGRR